MEKALASSKDFASFRAPGQARRHAPGAGDAQAPRVLLVATLFKLPYRALRCISATGAKVFVLGSPDAGGLRYSRYCEQFFDSSTRIDGQANAELVLDVNHLVNRLSIDLVVAGDAPSTRSLVEISQALDAPCFPMPDLETFDLLNNKWRFTQLCDELNIICPRSWLFSNANQLLAAYRRGGLQFPFIAKPVSADGGVGCIPIAHEGEIEKLFDVSYSPIIVQDFIQGSDIGASIFCRNGEIEAFLTHNYLRGAYTAYSDPAVYEAVAQIAWRLRLTGIFNFDMRLTEDGEVFFLECNPRMFFKIAMSMLAGINFVELGVPWRGDAEAARLTRPVTLHFPKAMVLTPWKLNWRAWRVAGFLADDPVPFVRESLRLEQGH